MSSGKKTNQKKLFEIDNCLGISNYLSNDQGTNG